MRYLSVILLLMVLFGLEVISQSVNVTVKTIYCHDLLENGTPSENKYAYIQKTYINNNQLVLERFYDSQSKKQIGFTQYIYDTAGRTKSIEHFNMDKHPIIIKQINYNDSGDTSKIGIYSGSQDTVAKMAEKTFYYTSSGQLNRAKTVSTTHKLIEDVRYYYKPGISLPDRLIVTNKTASPYKEKMEIIYADTTGFPISATKQITKKGTKYTVVISYNIKGKPVEEKYMKGDMLLNKKLYEYAGNVELIKYFEEDGNGIKTSFCSIDTYWEKAIMYIKSYFE